jgi:ornithine cyclodeaminase/alanine dehydrogenase-like protein (mu-crystallin family)
MALERKFLYLTRADVEAIDLPMGEIIDAVVLALCEKGHRRAELPPKSWIAPRADRFFSAMSSALPAVSAAACKWQSGSPDNARLGLPYITGLLILNDIATGVPLAVMDSTWLTAQRTAAATAVAIRHLAPSKADMMAVLGCGVQGRTNLAASRLVMPTIATVQAYDVDAAALGRYQKDMVAAHGVRVVPCRTPRDAVDGADIVVTCGPITANAARVIGPGWLKVGGLAVALDYDCYWTAAGLNAVDRVFTDDIGQLRHLGEYGYFTHLGREVGDLGDVVAGTHPGRQSPDHAIVSINMGIALEDVATARRIYDVAMAHGTGQWLPW